MQYTGERGGGAEKKTTTPTTVGTMLTMPINIIAAAIADSLSIHKSFRILSKSNQIAQTTGLTVVANGVLLLGSIALFHKGINPLINYIKSSDSDDIIENNSSALFDFSVYSFYHVLWILPMWILCYSVSTVWYQEIANLTYRLSKGSPHQTSPKSDVANIIYGVIVWICVLSQTLIIDVVIPSILAGVSEFIERNFPLLFGSIVTKLFFLYPLRSIRYICKFTGASLMSITYGWYGFDLLWISDGMDPDQKFAIVETYWLYFLGFGMPYMVLMKSSSFFAGYGLYLLLYPFKIMISSSCDFEAIYKKYYSSSSSSTVKSNSRLRIFRLPKYVALQVIRVVSSQFHIPKRYKYTSSSDSDSYRKDKSK